MLQHKSKMVPGKLATPVKKVWTTPKSIISPLQKREPASEESEEEESEYVNQFTLIFPSV